MKTLLVVSLLLIAVCFHPDAHSVKQVEELKAAVNKMKSRYWITVFVLMTKLMK